MAAAAVTEDRAKPERALADELIGDLAGLLNDARPAMRMNAGLLTGLAIAISLEAGLESSPLHHGTAGALSLVLLVCLVMCWLSSLTMLLMAGRAVLGILSEHRWRAGAPLDPRAPWQTLRSVQASPQEWTWVRARLMISVARIRLDRVQKALTWAFITSGIFLAWTTMVFVSR